MKAMQPDKGATLEAYLTERKALIDEALERFLPGMEGGPEIIHQAVRYSLFAGGKRIRPILCVAAAEAVGGGGQDCLPCACALEMIHTYSLIHDDLPAMDNDDYRRGMPTSHRVFGEGIAILAGDALLTEAFHLLSRPEFTKNGNTEQRLQVINLIARAAGMAGMVGGQVMDLEGEGKNLPLETIEDIHRRKTGAMLTVSVVSGAILAGATAAQTAVLASYGQDIGLAFQIADDILNVAGDSVLMGKGTGSDISRGKTTFPALMGLEASRNRLSELVEKAAAHLAAFDHRAEPLRQMARYIMERNR
ncbi:MAG TPA: farnesyl-diphosphate synthase [Syntrophus sp. (in: bacteria)]|jgi:geranylgeranyl diphosphate synthase type II|nr:farnesyl-diphosphate synthase [Syntrophus sp. (in: bacteria)]